MQDECSRLGLSLRHVQRRLTFLNTLPASHSVDSGPRFTNNSFA